MVCLTTPMPPHKPGTAVVCGRHGVPSQPEHSHGVCFRPHFPSQTGQSSRVCDQTSVRGTVVPQCFRPGVPSQTSRLRCGTAPSPLLSQTVRRCRCPPTPGRESCLGSVSLHREELDEAFLTPSQKAVITIWGKGCSGIEIH